MATPLKLTGDPTKDGLLNCLLELSCRADELGYADLASDLCVVLAAEVHGDSERLANLLSVYAEAHYPDMMAFMKEQDEKEEG